MRAKTKFPKDKDYDQDEEEEEYLQPDNADCVTCEDHTVLPPAYPPPPVPHVGKPSFSETRLSGMGGHPVPPPKKILPDVRRDLPFQYRAERSVRAQLLRQPTPNPGSPAPPVPLARKTTCLMETGSRSSVRPPLTPALPITGESAKLKELKLSAKAPPPLPSSKPRSVHRPGTPASAKPPRGCGQPVPLTPKILSTSQVATEKPPVLLSRPEKPSPPPVASVSARRSAPDGQSFRSASFEKPAAVSKPSVCGTDSDDDYEKVELPDTIFVNTTESLEVERMFKSENPTGLPKNGLFCIRNSSTKPGKVLVVWDASAEKVRNYRIFQQRESKFYLESVVQFSSLGSLVEHYCCHTLPGHDGLMLQFPYGYCKPR